MIPRIDATALLVGDADAMKLAAQAATGVGFLTEYNTPLSGPFVQGVIDGYGAFFICQRLIKRRMTWPRRDQTVVGAGRGLSRLIQMPTLTISRCLIVA